MRRYCVALAVAAGMASLMASSGVAQQAATAGPYHVLKTAKVGGDGGFDYVCADDGGAYVSL